MTRDIKIAFKGILIFALIEKMMVINSSVCYSACVEGGGDAGAGPLLPLQVPEAQAQAVGLARHVLFFYGAVSPATDKFYKDSFILLYVNEQPACVCQCQQRALNPLEMAL